MAPLDDACLARILLFVNEPRGRLCCKEWESHLEKSLKLKGRSHFMRSVRTAGKLPYHHSAVRNLGGMEECITYQFCFYADGQYSLHWFREGLTADNEQQVGHWHVELDALACRTLPGPAEIDDKQLRYAPPGRIFQVPLSAVLAGQTVSDSTPARWEYAARGRRAPLAFGAVEQKESRQTTRVDQLDENTIFVEIGGQVPQDHRQSTRVGQIDESARFVDIDGQVHQVSRDIMENWPEDDWHRLMRCRLRWGTGAERWP